MYELVWGSIFDKKCDVLVIPCNHMGGLSRAVTDEMEEEDIPYIPLVKQPGEIKFEENFSSFTNALVIGFAASVDAFKNRSKVAYLQHICEALLDYCRLNSYSMINIPLLGAGAGGLTAEEAFEVLCNHFAMETGIVLRIFVQSRSVFNHLSGRKRKEAPVKAPRVFISYTGENPANRSWVKELACALRRNGVNARLDLFHLRPGQDLPQWMTNELLMADKVLLICDKYYVKKADARKGGVGWETMIIQGDMLSDTRSCKYICIVREKRFDKGLPLFMKSKYSLQWTDGDIPEEGLQELLCQLFECSAEPEIGEVPAFIYEKKK